MKTNFNKALALLFSAIFILGAIFVFIALIIKLMMVLF